MAGHLLNRWLAGGCGLMLALPAFGAGAADRGPFFPPQSSVVLLAGLPGDLESENTYREQLQTWLEILGAGGTAQKLFVLCDDPQSVSATNNRHPPVTLLSATRTNFLSLGRSLAGQTNPLVVIAWGHGGKQGSTPVFHVRGPRIKPEDFKTLAGAAPAAESRWILFFRGSGSFGRQLAGESRHILSSESDTMFTSDPIGMTALLKLARARPELSFRAMSEELGRAIADWYKERNLARTEEPALWVANDPPRLLAPAAEEGALASVKPAQPEEAPAKKSPELPPATNDLPAVWKEIARVDAQKYLPADGVVLRRRLEYTLGTQPALATEQDEFIQILTAEGKRFGDFDVSYSPPFEDITFLDCEVLGPNGKLTRLDPDAIRESGEAAVGDYQRGHRKFFSLPGVGPGAVVRYHYRTQWKTFPLPHVSLEIPLVHELAVLDCSLKISLPKDSPFHFAFENFPTTDLESRNTEHASPTPDPTISQTTFGATYSWRFADLPARDQEVLSRPGRRSGLMFSTFADWPAFAEWYGRISNLADEVTPEIAAKASELAREAKTDHEKVLALYNYVTGLRYVAVPLGVNSFRPHAAANVLQNQYGDCKDKANLLNTFLRSLKMDAHLVLVPRFSQAHDDIPGLAFNHAISRVILDGQIIWVDTTDDVCRFGMLPPGDPGRKVLVIGGQEPGLSQLPAPEPKDHQLKLRAEVDCAHPATALPTTLSVTAVGYPDYALRETAREAKQNRASLPVLAARFRPVAGSFALEHQSASLVSALDEDFTWQAEGAFIGLSFINPSAQLPTIPPFQSSNAPSLHPSTTPSSISLHAPFWLPKEWDLALHRRKSALYLNQGYPLTLKEEAQFSLPQGAKPGELPGVSENTKPPLRWRIEWSRRDGTEADKLTASFRAELVRGELSDAETPMFQAQLRDLLTALAVGAPLTWPVTK